MDGLSPKLPLWDLSTAYKGLDSKEYTEDKARLVSLTKELTSLVKDKNLLVSAEKDWLKKALNLQDSCGCLYENLESFIYCNYSTGTTDARNVAELNWIESAQVPLKNASVLFRNALASMKDLKGALSDSSLAAYSYFVEEELALQEKQMAPGEEDLAADLLLSGGEAWGRLQQTISSTLSQKWDGDTSKTVTELRAMAYNPDRDLRKKAFDLELSAWKSVEIPMAAALNGVKGCTVTLNSRRGWKDTLEKSSRQARLSEKALSTMIDVMKDSMPVFRKYMEAKAKSLGIKKLAFYDIFAPVGKSTKVWSWDDCKDFLVDQFGSLSKEYSDFAVQAFSNNWIDALPREGKVGGGYCIGFPSIGESRILCNFDSSFDAVSTVAHELGHAYHSHVLKDSEYLNQGYPMTLAETASIFSETLVFNAALDKVEGKEKFALLETYLSGANQVITDILSRFLFEKEVFLRREKGELSPEEFCSLMLDAQKKTYGEVLDPESLHPYMWAVKGHYYSPGLAFYNFPYAFGQLFGLGLYSLFEKDRKAFPAIYNKVLYSTSRMSAVDAAAAVGFDLEDRAFWQSGIDRLSVYVDEFCALCEEEK